MKHKLIYFILFFVLLIATKLYLEPVYAPFDIKLREVMFKLHQPSTASDAVVIVDIDSKTINTLGQWPFSRISVAKTLENLSQAGAGIIGMDIVFSSPDRTSPHFMAQQLHLKGDFINSDKVLAQSVATSPTILGYFYDFKNTTHQAPPSTPAHFKKPSNLQQASLAIAKGVNKNIDPIQSAAYSSGFFNIIGLESGLVDKAALLLDYNGSIYPSLAFEMVRIASQSEDVELFYHSKGLKGIRLQTGDIKTDTQAGIHINYRGPTHSYTYLSFIDVYNNNFNPKMVEGKFVLVGASDIGLHDIVPTLYDATLPGVEVHATIIDNLLNADYLYTPFYSNLLELFLLFCFSIGLGLLYHLISARWVIVFSLLTFFSALGLDYWLMFEKHQVYNFFLPLLAIVISTLFFALHAYYNEQKQKDFIKQSFSKKVSAAVVEELIQQDINTLKSQKRVVTIFFSDIRDFTKISERLEDPQRLIDFLNTYLEPMSKAIIHSKGTIDKFIGDAIMAYWNAPLEVPFHADLALESAIKQLSLLEFLNLHLQKEFNERIEIGIGINTDEAIVAEIGSLGRSDYTLIGDSVNLASRCEGLCKFYGVSLIITEQTKNSLSKPFLLKELDTIRVLGKLKPVTLYEVLYNEDKKYEDELKLYNTALLSYKQKNFKNALEGFKELQKSFPIKLYDIYALRCLDFIHSPPKDFDGIYEAKQK